MKKLVPLFLISLFLTLFTSCGFYDDPEILLDSGWTYSTNDLVWFPIETSQFPKLSKVLPYRKGEILLKTHFTIPENLHNENLMIFFGNIKIASEFYLNGYSIGSNGFFAPSPFSIGGRATSYILPYELCNEDGENEILIRIYIESEGRISRTPVISTQENITAKQQTFDFFNSTMHLICSIIMFIIAIMYFTVYYLRRADKQYLSFAFMNLFSAFFLISLCIGEYPIIYRSTFSYLLFQKLFRGIAASLSSYFAVSFMRDFLEVRESLARRIYRSAITLGPCFFLFFTRNLHDFFLYLGISYIAITIHMMYAVRIVITEMIHKNKKVISLLLGFSPVLLSIIITIIIYLIKKQTYSLIIIFGWQVVVFVFLAMLIITFAAMTNRVDFLNANLEKLVQSRTEDLTKANTSLEETNNHLKFEIERAEKEIELASFVQQSFYNLRLPDFKNYEVAYYNKPMAGVSGDLYDVYFTKDMLEGFGLFDVSGHGISSGLVTMLVKNIINDEFYKGKKLNLEDVMNITNDRIIVQKGNVENYLTGVLARVSGNSVEFVNAGHPLVMHYKKKENKIELIKRGESAESSVIGISDFPVNFECVKTEVEKGDILLLYTDGLTETMNRNREEFGVDRLKRTFLKNSDNPIAEQIKLIVEEAKTFANRAKITDDITLLILKKK